MLSPCNTATGSVTAVVLMANGHARGSPVSRGGPRPGPCTETPRARAERSPAPRQGFSTVCMGTTFLLAKDPHAHSPRATPRASPSARLQHPWGWGAGGWEQGQTLPDSQAGTSPRPRHVSPLPAAQPGSVGSCWARLGSPEPLGWQGTALAAPLVLPGEQGCRQRLSPSSQQGLAWSEQLVGHRRGPFQRPAENLKREKKRP